MVIEQSNTEIVKMLSHKVVKCPICGKVLTKENYAIRENSVSGLPVYKNGHYEVRKEIYKNLLCDNCDNRITLNSIIVHVATFAIPVLGYYLGEYLSNNFENSIVVFIGGAISVIFGLWFLFSIYGVLFSQSMMFEITGSLLGLKWRLEMFETHFHNL